MMRTLFPFDDLDCVVQGLEKAATEEDAETIYKILLWRKLKGTSLVRLRSGRIITAEIHWYEAFGIGRKEVKIKSRVDRVE